MASLKEKIDAARKAGYPEAELQQFLFEQKEIIAAKKEGYPEQEILKHFGFAAPTEEPKAAVSTPPKPKPAEPMKPTEASGWRRLALQSVHSLRRGVAEGLGLGGTLRQLGNELLPESAKYWMPIPAELPTPAEVEQGLGWSDLQAQHPEIAPQGAGEEFLQAGLRGLGAALPMAAAVGATGGAALPLALAGGAGGLTGEAAKKALPGMPLAEPIAGTLGGLAAGGIHSLVSGASAARNLAARTAAAENALVESKEALRLARSARTDVVEAGREASKRDVGQALQEAEGRAGELRGYADELVNHVADAHGTSATVQEAGQRLQDSARNWLSNVMPQRMAEAWAPLDAVVPAETQTTLFGFKNALNEINKSGGKLEPLTGLLKPGMPARLKQTFEKILESPAGTKPVPAKTKPTGLVTAEGKPIERVVSEAKPSEPITWAEVQRLRTTLGDAMTNPVIIKDVGEQNLARLYAGLTSDMRGAAKELGAEKLFDEANEASRALYQFAEGPIGKIVRGPKPSAEDLAPEVVVSRLLAGGKKGASDLEALRTEMPDIVGELASAGLRSHPKFWSELSPEARKALVPDPSHSKALDLAETARANAAQDMAAAKKAGAEAHRRAVSDIQRASKAEIEGKVQAFEQAKADVNALAPKAPPPVQQSEARDVRAILSSSLMSGAVPLMLSPFGLSGPAATQAGTVIGASMPLAWQGMKAIARQPSNLLFPLAGTMGGNALNRP